MSRFLLFPVALLGFAGPVLAEAPGDEIVVSGQRALEPEVARAYVASVTRATAAQIARYHEPVCPVVMGLPAPQARIVERRIRSLAAEVGASAEKDGNCNGNLVVMLASDGSKLFDSIRRDKQRWLDGLQPADIRRIANLPPPVRSWHVTSLRNEDGRGTGSYGEDSEGAAIEVRSASYLRRPTRQHIDGSLLIIDHSAAEGLTLYQIAAYAVMRGLARTETPADARVDTILNLFTPGAPRPVGLSEADRIYLKALYNSDGSLPAIQEEHRIAVSLSQAKP